MQALTIDDIFSESESRMKKAEDALHKEYQGLRTGRASTALVEGVMINYYNATTPLKQLATISTPEPRTISIQPWDVGAVDSIVKSITEANLGLNPMSDGKVVRIQVPELTDERRQEISKVAKKYAEDSRVSVRNVRKEANDCSKKLQKEGAISEDDSKKAQDKIQKLTDKYIKLIDDLLARKEEEINRV